MNGTGGSMKGEKMCWMMQGVGRQKPKDRCKSGKSIKHGAFRSKGRLRVIAEEMNINR